MKSVLLSIGRPSGERVVSRLVGRSFAIHPSGTLEPVAEFDLAEDVELYPGKFGVDSIAPSLIRREMDMYASRRYTDLVIQGTVRLERARRNHDVILHECGRTVPRLELAITGNRRVEKGRFGLQLSEAEPFVEMPLRYDRAYGGTDAAAEASRPRTEADRILLNLLENELPEWGVYSYPRNPTGVGFTVDPGGAVGVAWPNVEFVSEKLDDVDILGNIRPLVEWGEQPYPASFDWFSSAWFPRSACWGRFPGTADGLVPVSDVALGVLARDSESRSLDEIAEGLSQCAHPYLSRSRLRGDERLLVSGLGTDGGELEVRLPSLVPRLTIGVSRMNAEAAQGLLDLVYVDAATGILSMVWRASWVLPESRLEDVWHEEIPYEVVWTDIL